MNNIIWFFKTLYKLPTIISAWWFHYKNPAVPKEHLHRVQICNSCEFKRPDDGTKYMDTLVKADDKHPLFGHSCGVCGCGLLAKIKDAKSECPKNKW